MMTRDTDDVETLIEEAEVLLANGPKAAAAVLMKFRSDTQAVLDKLRANNAEPAYIEDCCQAYAAGEKLLQDLVLEVLDERDPSIS
jgi:ElaB/YqjD/DUF883 family membrane-anchored ribosome-binding protein